MTIARAARALSGHRDPVRWGVLLFVGSLSCCVLLPRAAEAQEQAAFDTAITGLAVSVAPALLGKTVAVFEFPDLEGRTSNLSRMVSEQLTTELVQRLGSGGTVVERRQVLQVLAELKLQSTDLTATEVTRVGRQLGADAIVLGSVTILGDQIIVNARAVTVTGGRVVSAGRRSAHVSAQLLALAQSGFDVTPLTGRRTTASNATAPSSGSSTAAGVSSQPPPVSKSDPVAAEAQVQRLGPVSLSLSQCTHPRESVQCELTAVSREDYGFRIWTMGFPPNQIAAYTRLIDPEGNIHVVSRMGAGGEPQSGDTHVELVASIPVRVVLVFDGVPVLERVPLLELQVATDVGFSVLRFRDVPVR